MRFSILILAAGSSSRLGQPKQLVEFQGQTLISRIVQTAISFSDDILVVLGANSDLIKTNLQPLSEKIKTVINPNWQEGIGSSIKLGTEILAPKADAIMVLLSDQPFVSKELLQEIMQIFANSQNRIIACKYGNHLGVPMLFEKSVFPELLKLQGDKGARTFLNKYNDEIGIVKFEEGSFDIDTIEDLIILQNIHNQQ